MTVERFSFQRSLVEQTVGVVLNVGCDEDPAQIKAMAPDRVINCDINTYSEYMQRHNPVDVVMDVREKWPFPDDYAELTIMGDILEHLYPGEALGALTEALRVSSALCVTVPEDNRWETDGVAEDKQGARTHCYTWTWARLERLLDYSGWELKYMREVDYTFVPRGYFIYATRPSDQLAKIESALLTNQSAFGESI